MLTATEPDEVQVMQPEWVQAMLSRLRPNGKAVLLEDSQQQLYIIDTP